MMSSVRQAANVAGSLALAFAEPWLTCDATLKLDICRVGHFPGGSSATARRDGSFCELAILHAGLEPAAPAAFSELLHLCGKGEG